jgi:hypothetical protein
MSEINIRINAKNIKIKHLKMFEKVRESRNVILMIDIISQFMIDSDGNPIEKDIAIGILDEEPMSEVDNIVDLFLVALNGAIASPPSGGS